MFVFHFKPLFNDTAAVSPPFDRFRLHYYKQPTASDAHLVSGENYPGGVIFHAEIYTGMSGCKFLVRKCPESFFGGGGF